MAFDPYKYVERLRQKREQLGLSQRQVAQAINLTIEEEDLDLHLVSSATISQWETKTRTIDTRYCPILASLYDIPQDQPSTKASKSSLLRDKLVAKNKQRLTVSTTVPPKPHL